MKTTLTGILVASDFSSSADAALAYAKMLAERFGASLHLLHVLEQPEIAGAWGSVEYISNLPQLRETAEKEAEAHLDHALSPAERERLRATTEIADGQVARAIVDVGQQRGSDLIVMGTHGRTGVAHLLVGSVAEKVIRTASCPVLIVRGDEHAVGRQAKAS